MTADRSSVAYGGCTVSTPGYPGNRWREVEKELALLQQASLFEIACAVVDYRQTISNLQWRLNNVR